MIERNVSVGDMIPLIRETLDSGKTVSFAPRGVSMLPMLRQGRDTVTLSRLEGRLRKYDLPFYRRDDGTYVLHRIVKSGDTYTCIGDNQFALEPGIRHDQIIGVVSAFCRKGKTISVSHRGYKLYCRFWHWSRPVRHVCSGVGRRLRALFR